MYDTLTLSQLQIVEMLLAKVENHGFHGGWEESEGIRRLYAQVAFDSLARPTNLTAPSGEAITSSIENKLELVAIFSTKLQKLVSLEVTFLTTDYLASSLPSLVQAKYVSDSNGGFWTKVDTDSDPSYSKTKWELFEKLFIEALSTSFKA